MLESISLEENKATISRRSFLAGTGATLGGLAAGSVFGIAVPKAFAAVATLPFPFPEGGFSADDMVKIRQRAFDGYISTNCCYGAAKGLLETLQERLPGTAWDNIPLDMFKFGGGGILAWGTLCGALNGSLPIINCIAPDKMGVFADALLTWYNTNSFPSNATDSYISATAAYNTKYNFLDQPQSVPATPLCHSSVSVWVAKHNEYLETHPGTFPTATVGGDLKKARCGKLTADVAVKVAQMLNDWMIGIPDVTGTPVKTLPTAVAYDAATAGCMDCHTGTGTNSAGAPKLDSEQGKMTCGECHTDGGKNTAPACTK